MSISFPLDNRVLVLSTQYNRNIEAKIMDFLFTNLPKSNFEMTDAQLILWQRNAVFECDCENLMNHRIESGRESGARRRPERLQYSHLFRCPLIEQSAIDMAIGQHGLHEMNGNTSNITEQSRIWPASPTPHVDIYQEALQAAFNSHGLRL